MNKLVDIVPILDDNYVFMIRDQQSKDLVIVDPGDAAPCEDYIRQHGLTLRSLLITHHHPDHIDGIVSLKQTHPQLEVYAPEKNRAQIPWATTYVKNNDAVKTAAYNFSVFELPGHTMGICGYYEANNHWLFSGDVLFGFGCGRLFEGTPELLFASLDKIKNLPADTKVFCTHEYTRTNMRFVEKLIAENKMPMGFDKNRYENYSLNFKKPSVPLDLETELHCNPFLLAKSASELGELRQLRNQFK